MNYVGIESIDEEIERKIEEIRKRIYIVERGVSECNKLIPEVKNLVDDYIKTLEKYTINFHKPLNIVWEKAERTAKENGREDKLNNVYKRAFNEIWDIVNESVWKAGWPASVRNSLWKGSNEFNTAKVNAARISYVIVKNVAREVAWYVIKDIPGFENNPFEKRNKMYEIGVLPGDFRYVNLERRFIVHIPLDDYTLGCLADGDEYLYFQHLWYENCSKIQPLTISRIIETEFE
jgi:hypothetical protein